MHELGLNFSRKNLKIHINSVLNENQFLIPICILLHPYTEKQLFRIKIA